MAKGSGKKKTRLEIIQDDIQSLKDLFKDVAEKWRPITDKLKRIEEWLGEDWLNEEKEPESRSVMDEVSDFGARLMRIEGELGIDPTEQDDEEDEDVMDNSEEESPKKKGKASYKYHRYVITCEKVGTNLYWREKQLSSSVVSHKAYWTPRIEEAKLYTNRGDALDFMETDECEHFSGQTSFGVIRIDLHSMEQV